MTHQRSQPHRSSARNRELRLCGDPLPQPGHICAFFDSAEDKYSVLAPFFTDAIAAADRVINVVDGAALDDHLRTLGAAGVPTEQAIQTDRLRVRSTEETYMQGGQLNLDGVLAMVRDAIVEAEGEGRCLRTCGEMNWVGRDRELVTRALEYEAKVNDLLPGHECTLICAYDTARISAAMISDLLATHEYAIVKCRLRRNPYYVQPAEYLAMLRSSQGSFQGLEGV